MRVILVRLGVKRSVADVSPRTSLAELATYLLRPQSLRWVDHVPFCPNGGDAGTDSLEKPGERPVSPGGTVYEEQPQALPPLVRLGYEGESTSR